MSNNPVGIISMGQTQHNGAETEVIFTNGLRLLINHWGDGGLNEFETQTVQMSFEESANVHCVHTLEEGKLPSSGFILEVEFYREANNDDD